ncbi:hypothetical protein LUD75_05090 [Epilithonimonas sp. JDS]|uniref:hypothetical protein n=1 Tax=Epilithonimonas sp. JDS TaxID=2902797 RepID=UPI001E588CC6|nr:hypothetical protein [Epilithonimonas sp. JDS]MCD9854065.1 hypothetical protein [Epilithonimonas sp. JDS]
MNTYRKKISYIFYWTIIFVVAGSMIVYGISKPIQFQSFKDSVNVNVSEGHKLMWTFYSYSLAYPIIIGVFEVIGGVSLLFSRTRIFGCILLTVILSNIIIQDYIYEIIALSSAVYYQVLISIILIFDHRKLRKVVYALFKSEKTSRNISLIIVAFLIALIFKYLETKII